MPLWPFNQPATVPPAPQGMMLLECLDLSIVDHHSRQVLNPLTDPAVFDTVSDVLEIGFWIATEMPEQVPKDEGRDDTQLGPSELTRAHLLELARQLKELTSKYSPFGERFGGRANSQWGAAVSAIVEFQSVYEIVSVDGPVRMDPRDCGGPSHWRFFEELPNPLHRCPRS